MYFVQFGATTSTAAFTSAEGYQASRMRMVVRYGHADDCLSICSNEIYTNDDTKQETCTDITTYCGACLASVCMHHVTD